MAKFIYNEDSPATIPAPAWIDSPVRGEHCSLLQATEFIARTAPHLLPCQCAPRNLARSFQPRMMLFLLSYCYARQIYKSTDIERLVLTDALMRRCCGDEPPTAPEIRRFRSEHREALQFCLKLALRFLANYDHGAGLASKVDEARIEDEVNRRIITAMFVDRMETGGERSADESMELSYLFANHHPARH